MRFDVHPTMMKQKQGAPRMDAPCFCFVFNLLIHGSDCIRSNTL